MADDMTVPFILGLIAGIFVLIINVLVTIAGALIGSMPMMGVGAVGGIVAGFGIWGVIDGIILIVGSIMMRQHGRTKLASILVIVFGVLAFITAGFGLIIFPVLAIIGGALGLSRAK